MQSSTFAIFLTALTLSICPAHAQKPFKRALVFTGGGPNPASYYAYYQGAKQFWRDFQDQETVIIATCGSALGAALAQSGAATPEQALAQLKTPVAHSLMTFPMSMGLPGLAQGVMGLVGRSFLNSFISPRYPNFFDSPAYNLPQGIFDPIFGENFQPASETRPAVIMVAGRILYSRQEVGTPIEPENKLFVETFFTDPETGKALDALIDSGDLISSQQGALRHSFLLPKPAVITNAPLSRGLRATMAEPMAVPPAQIEEGYFVGGAIDLYPLALAHAIADEVAMTRSGSLDNLVERNTISVSFGIDPVAQLNERLSDDTVNYWIDDMKSRGVKFKLVDAQATILPPFIHLGSNIPDNFEAYSAKIDEQYEWGLSRAKAAFEKTEFSPAPVETK